MLRVLLAQVWGAAQVEDAAVEAGYRCAAFHPDGVILGTGTTDGLVLVWEVKQQKVRRLERHTEAVSVARGRPLSIGSSYLTCVYASANLPCPASLALIPRICMKSGLLRATTPDARSWLAGTHLLAA